MDTNKDSEFAYFLEQENSVTSHTHKLFKTQAHNVINWRWQQSHQFGNQVCSKDINFSAKDLDKYEDIKKLFHIGVSPYYLSLIAKLEQDGLDAEPLRKQVLAQSQELNNKQGQNDPLEEINHSPVPEVIHAYPDRVAFCVAALCPVYCRYCFRKRRDEQQGLHFNKQIIKKGIEYIKSQKSIKDVLITGGDPFIASDASIENLLQQISAISHVEVIRFGTRTPVALPYRVTKNLAKILSKYHPVWVNTHFNCVEEITPEARHAIANLTDAGIPVGNQSVLLKGVNNTTESLKKLCQKLISCRVRPYYLFYPHLIEGTEHLRGDIMEGVELIKSLRGNISGFAIPNYVVDTPSGKIPLSHNYTLAKDNKDLILEDIRGEIWREKEAFPAS
jgi:lysine 2,3-aminomutase